MTRFEIAVLRALGLIMRIISFSQPMSAYGLFEERINRWEKQVNE